jgi:hypothetical protein
MAKVRIRKSGTLTVDGAGAASKIFGGDATGKYVRVLGFEFKTIVGTDQNHTLALTDGDSRIIFKATALDSTTDDSTLKQTEQTTSTTGVRRFLAPAEADVVDAAGDASADAEGNIGGGVWAKFPITATIASGTEADTVAVNLITEEGNLRVRTGTIAVGAAATSGATTIGSVNKTARLVGVELKTTSGTDASHTLVIAEADGRQLFTGTVNGYTDDGTLKKTRQTSLAGAACTRGLPIYIAPIETNVIDSQGDASADTEGAVGGGLYALLPLTVTVSSTANSEGYDVLAFLADEH